MFMNVRKEKTGKTIKKIKVNQKAVAITFTNGERIDISYDAYSSMYLYVGKELKKSEIDKLNSITLTKKLVAYAMSLLSKKHYTEWKMREKLYAKGGEKKDVDYVISRLKAYDLLNDKEYIEDYLGYAEEKNIGKNKIKQDLLNRGVFEEEIKKIHFNETLEKKKAVNNIPHLEKKYAKYSYEKKKEHILSALISLGFDFDVANYALSKIKGKNEKDEKEKLNKDFQKVYTRLKERYEGKELFDKVIKTLMNKGYRYKDIKEKIGESYDF